MPKNALRPIALSHASLEKLFAAFHIHPEGHGMVLFALRGALPVKAAGGWASSLQVIPAPLDYVHMRCTLGIWDRRGKRVFAAPGSTVPHKDNVVKAAARKGRLKERASTNWSRASITGSDQRRTPPGQTERDIKALRQTEYRLYRRSLTGIPYRSASPLYYGNPMITFISRMERGRQGTRFSTA